MSRAVAAPEPRLWGWGRVPAPGREQRSEDLEALTRDAVLSRGLGRSYGDSALPPRSHPVVAGTTLADRILAFDPASGRLRAEAGLTLREVVRLFLPRGLFPPVTPGTQYVTLGGMVASDVHGKNHHVDGTIGRHVTALKLRVASGQIVECTPEREGELFRATVGGMGLTGHILEVEFALRRVPSPWILGETERVPNLEGFVDGLEAAAREWPMTMGWIDCLSRGESLGRGILYRGRWATPDEAPRRAPRPKSRFTVPFVMPEWLLGPLTVRTFNFFNYHQHVPRVRRGIVHPEAFFYPLDMLLEWNRLYGPRGFTQYQCVLPRSAGRGAARRFLDVLSARGGASFLCVIKDCGEEGAGLLSFPRPGISIALDIALRDDTQALVDALNETVIAEGGRVYLTKDSLTRPEHFRAMEPRLEEFLRVRRKWDPEGRLRSAQSVRLFGDRP
ncbi:MAG: FAD-binding oxidoreductase [Vicinamibacteria bacterium]|nr:FAD-binding oxidoreductase [Vicinamibacteria bacterium]